MFPFGVNESGVIVGVYDTDPTFATSSAYILDDGVYSFFNHPNPKLEALGKERGWEVMHPARPYHGKLGSLWFSAKQARQ